MKKNLAFYNITIFFVFILIGEIIFGDWFKGKKLGLHMRGHINASVNVETEIQGIKKDFIFFRNSSGFRNYEIDNNKIDIVFVGGSTTIQSYLPYEETIVGILNQYFKNDDILIANAGLEGKSSYGYLCDFKFWFNNLENLNPKYYIFYTGLNDVWNVQNSKKLKCDGITSRQGKLNKISDYLINTSFILSRLKIIKHEIFREKKKFYISSDQNKKFITYDEAKEVSLTTSVDNQVLNTYKQNLKNLKKLIDNKGIKPIFITQVSSEGIKNPLLFHINRITKKFAIDNDYKLIKLDEEININSSGFYDSYHTNFKGSKIIADYLFKNLQFLRN
tara:strand:- start:154 stop:1152 length:999 start_codon:yes stop_codon:yes gene_type:complete